MRYMKLTGEPCKADDPERGVWYSASCGYWTDQWDCLSNTDKIPCCPSCGCPGYQTKWKNWFDGAKRYEEDNHPGYCEFLLSVKEKCYGKGWSHSDAYQKWMENQK